MEDSIAVRSTKRQTFDKINELPCKNINSIESLPRIDRLCIDKSAKKNLTNKLAEETVKQIVKSPVNDFKEETILYDIDEMSPQELQASLHRIKENPRQPFSFLANISELFTNQNYLPIEKTPTEIDIRLAAVAKRIESNKIFLKEAKSRIEELHLRAKRDNTALNNSSLL